MSYSAKVTREIEIDSQKISKQETLTAGARNCLSESVPDGSTDLAVTFTCDVSTAKWIYLTCDKAVTIKTNNAGAPTDTITLTAGQSMLWTNSDPTAARPFSADVTALFVTNASGVAAALQVEVGQDPTP